MIRIAVCDDDSLQRDLMREMLDEYAETKNRKFETVFLKLQLK